MYSNEQQEEFCSLAQQMGITKAMKHLGYPASRATAHVWLDQRNITIEVDALRQRCVQLRELYSDADRLSLLNALLSRIFEHLENEELSAADLQKLVSAARQTIETTRLISGQSTKTIQTIDSMDSHINKLLSSFRMNREKTLKAFEQQQLGTGQPELSTTTQNAKEAHSEQD